MSPETFLIMSDRKLTSLSQFNRLVFDSRDFTTSLSQKFLDLLRPYKEKSPHIIGLASSSTNDNFSKMCEMLQCQKLNFNEILYPSEGIAAAEIPEINDIIVDYEKSANPKSSETRVTLVLEFLTQAILRILHFKLENTFPANGTTIQKVEKLFSIFSAKEADRQDVKSSIDEFKRINDISLEFGPYPATIFAKDLFLKLNSKYTISQSDNHDSLMKSLAIKRHLIRPSDLSSKWWSFCETIRSIQSTFDNQDSFARIVVCTQSRQSAHVIQKLVEDLSDMFDIGVCDVADENHMDEQDLGSKKCSLLVLEKDVFDSVELSLQINTVLLFDTNDFTVSFVQQLRSNPVFRNVQCAAMVQRDNEVAIKLIATLSFNYSLSKQEEFLKEAKNEQNQKTIKGTMELLIGNLGLGQIESGSNYRILPQQAIQTLEWFLSLNKEAPPVVKQEWPPMGNNEDINQVWDTLKNDIVSQEDESNPELEAILLLDPSSGVEFYISSCSWVYKGSEYRLLGAPRATLEMSRQAVGLDACLFLQSEELLDKTCRPIYVQSSAERKAAKNDYDYSHVPPMRPKAFEYFDEKQHEFHVAVIELKSDTKSPCPFRNHSIALATKYPFTSQDIPEFPVWIQDEEYKACVKSLKKPINFSSKELGAVRQFQNLLWEGLGGVSRLEKVNKEDGRFFFVVPCMEIQQTVGGSGEKDYQVDLDYLNHLDPNMHCTAYQLLSHLAVTETPIESISQEIFKATRSETKSSDLESLLSRYSKGQDTSSMIDYLNQYVSSCIIHATNHPSQKYTGLSVDEAITGNDYFASGEANCISFKDYFEQKGYKIDHPTVFGIKGICECKFPNGMVEAENEISEEVYETFLLEVSTVYPITAWLAAQFNVLPSILHHLETFSVISDLFEKLHVEPIPYSIIYPAFIHSNSDEGVDNERLEFLGDSSLKLISSLYLYQHEHYKEGQLTKYKGRIVSNFSLNIVGRHWNFDGMMKQIKFNASFFNPPFHACLARRAQPLRVISLKVCADFVEAVAGAFVLHRGVDFSWTYFERLGIVPSQSSVWAQIDKNTASDSSSIVSLCEVLESKCPNVVEKVEKAIKYRFKNPLLLVEALTHSSISSDSNYERLEFVGDAVLDFVLANYTFREYSKASPAVLSHLKYAAVNNEAFSRMSFTLGLYQYFAYEDEALKHDIDLYVEYLESFSTLPDPAFTEREGPKVLGDIFESVIGAVYIDCRGDWPTIWNVLIPMWKPYLDKFANPETLVTKDLIKLYQLDSINGKNVEFKYSQGQNDQDICHLYVEGKHVSSASANTKRLAREKAASIAYGKLSQ